MVLKIEFDRKPLFSEKYFKIEFDSKPAYNEKYLKLKVNSYEDKQFFMKTECQIKVLIKFVYG